jgi:hypothetical protein
MNRFLVFGVRFFYASCFTLSLASISPANEVPDNSLEVAQEFVESVPVKAENAAVEVKKTTVKVVKHLDEVIIDPQPDLNKPKKTKTLRHSNLLQTDGLFDNTHVHEHYTPEQ